MPDRYLVARIEADTLLPIRVPVELKDSLYRGPYDERWNGIYPTLEEAREVALRSVDSRQPLVTLHVYRLVEVGRSVL